MSELNAQAASPISRRTFAKGAAWAAPVVAIAIAAPAAAASGTGNATVARTGNQGHTFRLTITATSAITVPAQFQLAVTNVTPTKDGWAVVAGTSGDGATVSGVDDVSPVFTWTLGSSMAAGDIRYIEMSYSKGRPATASWTLNVIPASAATISLTSTSGSI